ncbi:rhamnogalacturonan endolyase [Geosmithia morbida]|uniref:Rhamnogalacturonate lyase n=1 Tax=Geosmithia morbida TaxID=1094350 RepID=A0A9P4YV25_9HYPO|nr:rhamnogalacturonan endolyase [Geosmithia morbida]KAF4122218.1 rhamnogalacturonan endolyase [Geosmithia morbida]
MALAAAAVPAQAAFGYTSTGGNYVIDAGSAESLKISVSQSSCDINSIIYRGTELQDPSKGSHLISGLGSATVSIDQGDDYIKVTCEADPLIHYMVVRSGQSAVYMATHSTEEPSIGELRFIARLKSSVLPYESPFGNVSTTANSQSTVEGSDVFVVDGETRSKFYSSERYIDKGTHCVWGDSVDVIHACMLVPQHETSSGGPFFRDIESNNAGDATNLYNYMNSGHVQTEAFRTGLHGPYVLQFSRSGIPSLKTTDVSWMSSLGLKDYVAAADRGTVSGTASGIDGSQFQTVVHWFNDDAQYWTYATSSGAFTSPAMKPGTYTMVLYQTEYEVARSTGVTVTAGETTSKDIASGLTAPDTTYFQIGQFDGQPTGFRNADKFQRMHPSDDRMASWASTTFTVGSSSESDFPMAIFADVNAPQKIAFNLDAAPDGETTLTVATTLSFAGARPQVTVNDFTGAIPSSPTNLNSRGVTRGAYRGLGEVYTVTIPAGTLTAGSNTISINPVSGSSGDEFLSPNFIVDAISLTA